MSCLSLDFTEGVFRWKNHVQNALSLYDRLQMGESSRVLQRVRHRRGLLAAKERNHNSRSFKFVLIGKRHQLSP